MKIIEKENRN